MTKYSALIMAGFLLAASPSFASERPRPSSPDDGWRLSVGAATLLSPNYLGDDDYRLSLVPYLRVQYGDRFFASVEEGAGYNLIKNETFRAGPLASIEFGRDESEGGPFRLIGDETTDLMGLGDVGTSILLGGFAEIDLGALTARGQVGQAINGHDGFRGEISVRYGGTLRGYGPPIIYSFGPRLSFGDNTYHDAFFSVDATQAAASGLSQFDASSGLLSYGLNGTVIMPLNDNVTMTLFGNFSRLSGDAADSSLVTERGSPNQAFFGLATAYTF